jgi:TolB protein
MKRMKSSVLFAIMFVGNFLLIHPEQMASAEGGKIVFTLLRDGNGGIYIIDDNGENLRQLTDHLAHDSYPVWLPDGRHIVFCSNRDGVFSIYTMDLAGKNIKRTVDAIGRPAVSPNGQWIALAPDEILLLVDIDGLKRKEIRWGRPHGATGMAAWAPDGNRLAFTIRLPGVGNDIYVVDITGDNLQQLTDHPWQDLYPTWSPDGQWIAFWSNRDGGNAIYLMDADGANPKRLANGRSPERAPDGQQIAFVSRQDDIEGIFIMDTNGENIRLLVEGGDQPSWFGVKLAVSDVEKWITLWGRMKRETD